MQLPNHLNERWCRRDGALRDGECVVYWMRTAVRGHENPALDASLVIAEALKVPLIVYHALSERTPYANDRHHTFILEGARDVRRELAARSIPYAFHLERSGHRGSHLKTLAQDASVVVTEEMPVSPLREWTERLAVSSPAPVWTFDTSCVVPMPLAERPYTRAFRYRDAVKVYARDRLPKDWSEQPDPRGMVRPDLPFEPVDLDTARFQELIAECDIDHAVAPVSHTRGGSRAGYARWERFKQRGLKSYAKTRNDPLRDGVSRMSAYLHYGQVSPFRLAREAHALKATKYLDELVTWRELAYTYCYYTSEIDSVEALPDWALESLQAAERDRREVLLSWESLSRAQSGDQLWDACQDSLLIHGELHNNVRMTWGKAFLGWTPNVERALSLTLDLNHRYALDGRDPSSYGGILWCFGQFDRPFGPAKKITGLVRSRPTEPHAGRLDVRAYHAKTGRPLVHNPPRVAMVGAGIAGMMCARTLSDHGLPVTVFDKGRGPGGRMSTRREQDFGFDHGSQYFVARDREFRRYVLSWCEDGVAQRWIGRDGVYEDGVVRVDDASRERFVGTPSMSSVVAHLSRDLEVRLSAEVTSISGEPGHWVLHGGNDSLGAFDVVLFGAPAPQTARLIPTPDFSEELSRVRYRPSWSLMLGVDGSVDWPWDSVQLAHPRLAWLARNDRKPGRAGGVSLVAQASAEWAKDNVERDPEHAVDVLRDAVLAVTGINADALLVEKAHRWRYALVDAPLGRACLWDEATQLGACGDWALGARVEDAFKSGVALAGSTLGWIRGD